LFAWAAEDYRFLGGALQAEGRGTCEGTLAPENS
jgi:hypothetical protein